MIQTNEELPVQAPKYKRRDSNFLSNAELVFDDMKFVVGKGKNEKVILDKVGARITSGHVLAMMGPSGAGKSTLISALTQDAHYGKAFGTMTLNGMKMTNEIFKRYCYVVKQYDNNWPYLTTRETLVCAADLYNVTTDKSDIPNLVDEVIAKMGLVKAADTKAQFLSGGQQRRLSLAIALLKQPTVLFLDEPTSGLDAASSKAIMNELTRVAKEEKLIIICTIHQPSSKVFNDFDQVMILSRGQEAYVGNASKAEGYFEKIGYPLPPATNAAEHFLDVVNADFSSPEEVDQVLKTWSTYRKNPTDESSTFGMAASKLSTESRQTFRNDFQVMLRRNLLLVQRDTMQYLSRFVSFLIVNCIFAIVYIKARPYTQDMAMNKLWVNAWFFGVPGNMSVVVVYAMNMELKSIFREVKNGQGSVLSYILSRIVLVVPIIFALAVAALAVPGFLIQDFPIETIGWYILLWSAGFFVWESSAFAFAALCDDTIMAVLGQTTHWFVHLLFGGFLIPVDDLYWPLKVFYYITPGNYYIRSAVHLQFTNEVWEACTDQLSSAVCVDSTDGSQVLAGLLRIFPFLDTASTYWTDLLVMTGVGLGWLVFGIAVASYKANQASKIHTITDGPGGRTPTLRALPIAEERNSTHSDSEDPEV